MHVGLIGGIGPAATTFYYSRLSSAVSTLQLTITHAHMPAMLDRIRADQQSEQADVFAAHILDLNRAGANVAALTAIAAHFCIDVLQQRSAIPVVSALDCLNNHFVDHGIKRVGVLGSPFAMKSKLFGKTPAVDIVVPTDAELDSVGNAYMAMAAAAHCSPQNREICFEAGRKLVAEHGVDVVLLGGTDLFLAFDGHNPGYDVLDAADVHISALAKLATP